MYMGWKLESKCKCEVDGFVSSIYTICTTMSCMFLETSPIIDLHIWHICRLQESQEQYSGPKVTPAISSTATLCPSNKPHPQAIHKSRNLSEYMYNTVYIVYEHALMACCHVSVLSLV